MSISPNDAALEAPIGRALLKVLVVDDNVDAAEALADVIMLWGHEAITAFDGASALAALHADRFDVVIVDITLPDFDGYELARRFKATSTTVIDTGRWIALSGRDDDVEQSGPLGFVQHLRKPVEPDHLAAALRAA